jgi:hypothetical protein
MRYSIITLALTIFLFGCNSKEDTITNEKHKLLSQIIGYDVAFKMDSIFYLYPTLNGNITSELLAEYVNSFDTIFTLEDKEYMIQQYSTYSNDKINRKILKTLSNVVSFGTENCNNVLYLSIPMITIDKQHSMTYISLRKTNLVENWVFIHRKDNKNWKLIGMKPFDPFKPSSGR